MIKIIFKLNLKNPKKMDFDRFVNKYFLDLKKYRQNKLKLLKLINNISCFSFIIDHILFDTGFWLVSIFAFFPLFIYCFTLYRIFIEETFF